MINQSVVEARREENKTIADDLRNAEIPIRWSQGDKVCGEQTQEKEPPKGGTTYLSHRLWRYFHSASICISLSANWGTDSILARTSFPSRSRMFHFNFGKSDSFSGMAMRLMLPISSFVASPHCTRTGGLEG